MDCRVKYVDHATVELIHVRPSEELRAMLFEGDENYTEYKPHRTPVREYCLYKFTGSSQSSVIIGIIVHH